MNYTDLGEIPVETADDANIPVNIFIEPFLRTQVNPGVPSLKLCQRP